ncbi:MAG: hypothetical protein ACI4NA_04615, partial [Succinivibrio sp.]
MRRILTAIACTAAFAMLGLAATMLWYLLYTTDGARLALRVAASALEGTASIDMRIKSGTLAHGFDTDGAVRVEVPGTVRVSADSLSLRYSLRRYLLNGTLVVDTLEAPSLEVLLEPSPDSREESGGGGSEGGAFRVDIPIKAVVRHIVSSGFAYRSEVVDVFSRKVDLSASCGGDYAGVLSGTLEGVEVHLKYRGDGKSAPLPRVESFGGSGIEPFSTIDLPLDTEIRNLLIKGGRFWMDGFDTGTFDAYVDAGWKGHVLSVKRIGLNHAWGHAGLSGSMDFSRYFGLDFDLTYRGASDEAARSRFKGSLAGLEGRASVRGDLSDLRAQAENLLPLPCRASARINALSGLFPLEAEASAPVAVWPLWMPPSVAGSFGVKKQPVGDLPDPADAAGGLFKIPSDALGLRAENASASVKGLLEGKLKAEASGIVSGYGLEDVEARAEGALEEFSPVLSSLKASGKYMGAPFKASLQGQARLGEGTVFAGRAEASSDDPRKAAPFLTGKTWAGADAEVSLRDGSLGVALSSLKGGFASGRLAPGFSAKSLELGSAGIRAEDFVLSDAAGVLRLSGLAGPKSDLKGSF